MECMLLNLLGQDDFFAREAYKVLRTNLQFCGANMKMLAFTSCGSNEGKTTITLSLGKSLSELKKKVLVIDADMRKSIMAGRHTTAKNVVGLSELLTGQKLLGECIYTTQYEQLDILFAGKYPPNPVELLSGDGFRSLLEQVREMYDYVLIDTPPLGIVIDAAVIAPYCDGSVLVIGDGVRRSQAADVVKQLKTGGSSILGVVRNNAKKEHHDYYYRRDKKKK